MYVRRYDNEPVSVNGHGNFIDGALNPVLPQDVVEVCDICEEPGYDHDPLAHFKHPQRFGDYVMAHGDCGDQRELELA